MAYHYHPINSVFVNPIQNWQTAESIHLYQMLPRLLETGYILFFSLTKTYAVARLLHFLIFFSSIFSIAIFLKKNLNIVSATVYTFLVLFLQGLILIESTFGHIDVGAAALANLTLITICGYLLTREKGYIFAAAGLFGLSMGIKYTVLTFLVAITVAGAIITVCERYQEILKSLWEIKKHKFFLQKVNYLLIIPVLILIFGGYWYVKNYFVTGNPIYPFLFACKDNIPCGTKHEFFGDWGITLDIKNFETIKNELFSKNNNLFITTLTSLFLGLILSSLIKNKIVRTLSLLIPLSIFIEIMVSRSISGFFIRYYYHWVLLIPLILSLPLPLNQNKKLV